MGALVLKPGYALVNINSSAGNKRRGLLASASRLKKSRRHTRTW